MRKSQWKQCRLGSKPGRKDSNTCQVSMKLENEGMKIGARIEMAGNASSSR
jgi:hypothetical protein